MEMAVKVLERIDEDFQSSFLSFEFLFLLGL